MTSKKSGVLHSWYAVGLFSPKVTGGIDCVTPWHSVGSKMRQPIKDVGAGQLERALMGYLGALGLEDRAFHMGPYSRKIKTPSGPALNSTTMQGSCSEALDLRQWLHPQPPPAPELASFCRPRAVQAFGPVSMSALLSPEKLELSLRQRSLQEAVSKVVDSTYPPLNTTKYSDQVPKPSVE